MSEAILPTQAIEQENHQTKDWSPAKVTYAVLMALTLIGHLWMMLIGSGIDNIPTYIWIIRLLTVPFAICLGKLWKDRGFQILSVYFLLFFLRCFIPNPGSIFSVEVAESIPGALWLFAGCYGLAKILTPSQLKRVLTGCAVIWNIAITVFSCLGIYAVWTENAVVLLNNALIRLFVRPNGIARLDLVYLATTSGALLVITILTDIIMILCTKNRFYKLMLLLSLLPIILATALTDSRTAFISISTGAAIIAFVQIFQYYSKKQDRKTHPLRPWIIGIMIMLGVFFILVFLFLQINPVFNRIRTQGIIPRALAEEAEKINVASRGFSGEDVLNGRSELWTNVIEYINQNKIILLRGESKMGPTRGFNDFYGHCHCLYLQVLLESGITGLLLVLVFIVYTAINAIRAITNPALPLWIRLLPAVFASMAIADLVECFLWLRATQAPMPAVFFITAGILNILVPKKSKKKPLPEAAI